MKIVKTTDNKHIGKDISDINKNDVINLNGFLFEVTKIQTLENGNILFSNPNYQLECEK